MKTPRKRVEQAGSVEGPKNGSFFLRYWGEPNAEGKRQRKTVEVGSKGQFRTRQEAAFSIEAAQLRRAINAGVMGVTMGKVIDHFQRDAMPARTNTRRTVEANLQHCREGWDGARIAGLATPAFAKRIEGWLNSLKSRQTRGAATAGRPLTAGTRSGIKQQMAALFDFAMHQGYLPGGHNPMRLVRVLKAEKLPERQMLTPRLLEMFFADPAIPEFVKVICHVAKFTGLRISEIMALKRDDFDLDECTVKVRRRISRGNLDAPKSEKSGDPVPFPEELYTILSTWMKSPGFYPTFEGWVFASPCTGKPYSHDGLYGGYIRPFGIRHSIARFGWHTFRHSYKQFLEDSGVSAPVVQRLMRHSSYQTTAKYGAGVPMDRLRAGQQTAIQQMNAPEVKKQKRRWA